ncbi:MAG: phospho-2-dehydro-3-deoxyheptonate aldolase [Candidatus Zixiibacteriota bacterium]
MAAGADGLLVEVHHDPVFARSDGGQSISPDMFKRLMQQISAVAEVVGRSL